MVTFIGWAVIILGGAYLAFAGTTLLVARFLRGGLETLLPALIAGGVAALLWIVGSIWMSPITISISAS